jgi:hypothetical protein
VFVAVRQPAGDLELAEVLVVEDAEGTARAEEDASEEEGRNGAATPSATRGSGGIAAAGT